MVLAVILAANPSSAHANWRKWHFGGTLDMLFDVSSQPKRLSGGERVWQSTVGLDLRALASKNKHIGLAVGIDVELGAERPGAFVYGFHLHPLGIGLRLGDRAWLGLTGGVGVGGATGRLTTALELPARAFLEFDLGSYVRASFSGRGTWIVGAASRENGSSLTGMPDEIRLSAGFAFGKRHRQHRATWSDGTFVGVTLREQGGLRMLGVVVAIAITAAN